ncbi:MAG: hypothetical protein IKO41_06255 [Lachnospiraceae bacterium]|nr:hypothetical protein [Lachnospiraceae bacterium]
MLFETTKFSLNLDRVKFYSNFVINKITINFKKSFYSIVKHIEDTDDESNIKDILACVYCSYAYENDEKLEENNDNENDENRTISLWILSEREKNEKIVRELKNYKKSQEFSDDAFRIEETKADTRIIAKLLLNSLSHKSLAEENEFSNISGSLYRVFKTKVADKEVGTHQLITLKFDIYKDLILTCGVATFTDLFTLKKRKSLPFLKYIYHYPQYVFKGANQTLSLTQNAFKNFKAEKYPEETKKIYINKQIKSWKSESPKFINFNSILTIKDSKREQIKSIQKLLNNKYGYLAKNNSTLFDFVFAVEVPYKNPDDLQSYETRKKKFKKRCQRILNCQHVNLSIPEIPLEFQDDIFVIIKDEVKGFTSPDIHFGDPDSRYINIMIVENPDYYKNNKLRDPYSTQYAFPVQHITRDSIVSCIKDGAIDDRSLKAKFRACLFEWIIKSCIYKNDFFNLTCFYDKHILEIKKIDWIAFVKNFTIFKNNEKESHIFAFIISHYKNIEINEIEPESEDYNIYKQIFFDNKKIDYLIVEKDKRINKIQKTTVNILGGEHTSEQIEIYRKNLILKNSAKSPDVSQEEVSLATKTLNEFKNKENIENNWLELIGVHGIRLDGYFYYISGWNLKGDKYLNKNTFPKIRLVVPDDEYEEEGTIFERCPDLLNFICSPIGAFYQGFNILPFPIKFMREYAKKMYPEFINSSEDVS